MSLGGYSGLAVKQRPSLSLEDLLRENAVKFSNLAFKAEQRHVEHDSSVSRIDAIELRTCAKLLNDLLAAVPQS